MTFAELHTTPRSTSREGGKLLCYDAVAPGELGAVFPARMGVTSMQAPRRLELVADRSDRGVAVRLDHEPYSPGLHPSHGVKAGRYYLDLASGNAEGSWRSGALDKYLTSHKATWQTVRPPAGAHPVDLVVSDQLAADVKAAEDEHVSDFGFAWTHSIGLVATKAANLNPAPDLDSAIGALVDGLVADGATYLVPTRPDTLADWRSRLLKAYTDLCDQSEKRDKSGEHAPVQHLLSYENGRVVITFVAGPRHPNSSDYIKPAEVAPVFTATSYASYRRAPSAPAQPRLPFAVGDRVRWKDRNIPMPMGDLNVHAQPQRDSMKVRDPNNVPYQMTTYGGVVRSIERTDVGTVLTWVEISLQEEPSEPGDLPELTSTGQTLNQDHGYLLLSAEDLARLA